MERRYLAVPLILQSCKDEYLSIVSTGDTKASNIHGRSCFAADFVFHRRRHAFLTP